jgi:hypothetical protein
MSAPRSVSVRSESLTRSVLSSISICLVSGRKASWAVGPDAAPGPAIEVVPRREAGVYPFKVDHVGTVQRSEGTGVGRHWNQTAQQRCGVRTQVL